MDFESSSSSLKYKIRSSICFSCCFSSSVAADPPPPLIRSSSTWIRSKAHDLPEIKDKCLNLISRAGRHHRRGQSGDFRYDPLSYALNFDEGNGEDLEFVDEEFRGRNFSSRLPASPPETRRAVVPAAVGVTCS